MILVFGLGNPGKKYEKTRHNLGFRAVDKFYKKNRDVYIFSNFKLEKKFQALISEGILNNQKIILVKPQTFMNDSGQAVKQIIKDYLINNAMADLRTQLWVVHDDIDLPLGKIRISINRGAAGHKGVKSIIKELKTKNFVRFRIGITSNSKCKMQNAKLQSKIQNFVLGSFTKTEEKILKETIKKTIEAIETALNKGVEKAMSKYNK